MTVGSRNLSSFFGRVPLFYYVLHWYLLHLVAIALAWVRYGRIDFMFGFPPSLSIVPSGYPADYGYHLLDGVSGVGGHRVWRFTRCAAGLPR